MKSSPLSSPSSSSSSVLFPRIPAAANPVLVAGATGGVGQLVVAQLLHQGCEVRVLVRDRDKGLALFGDRVQVTQGDTLRPQTLPRAVRGVKSIICCTGTTAFPSARWGFEQNLSPIGWLRVWSQAQYREQVAATSPRQVDSTGLRHLIGVAPADLYRFVLVSSAGVLRRDQFPYSVLNQFGVLDAKAQAEAMLQVSGLPYTVLRPGRLIDGPYTSYDLNRLLQATTEGKLGVVLGQGDQLRGQTSRIDVAGACVACLGVPETAALAIDLVSRGDRPNPLNWTKLLQSQVPAS
ncbi:MAG: SDR family oxidoreductase [Prochlorothrix sp.]|nr:SDR family oxidoreductase [Prochlorothrix sp.]